VASTQCPAVPFGTTEISGLLGVATASLALGGVDLRDGTLDSLRRRIVMLPQEGHLFSGTIADNVRLADPAVSDSRASSAMEFSTWSDSRRS